MKGRIQYVNKVTNDPKGFKGRIITEEGGKYDFNQINWSNQDLTAEDIIQDAEVEFDLKKPNKSGIVYPKNIRFVGEVIDKNVLDSYETKHSHGDIKDFVYIFIPTITAILSVYADDFDDEKYANKNELFKKIAITYNTLQDSDFLFSNDTEKQSVHFPSGFSTKDGEKIYLYCVENQNSSGSTWYCDSLFCKNHILRGVLHGTVNSDWYEIHSALQKFLPDYKEQVNKMVVHIERRCMQDSALIWLKDGYESSPNDASHLYVPTGYMYTPDNASPNIEKELYMYCTKRNGPKGYGWYYYCITYENAPLDVYDKKSWLELWSEFDWEQFCSNISDKTLEERWSFGDRNDNRILQNYLIYTFAHQWKNNGVTTSKDKKYAAFDTGLPEKISFKHLYAFYEKLSRDSSSQIHPLYFAPQYRFRDIVVTGRGGDGKLLCQSINPLPAPPQYFKSRSQTVWEVEYDDSNQIKKPEFDDTHILTQRCERLPLKFFEATAGVSSKLDDILKKKMDNEQKYNEIRSLFASVTKYDGSSADPEVRAYKILYDNLTNVIKNAMLKLSWNWRAVVPCYNPEREENCFLLPVSFCDDSKPDRAMIASAIEIDGKIVGYTIHTVITLDMAYLDARLVCRPEAEWLAINTID